MNRHLTFFFLLLSASVFLFFFNCDSPTETSQEHEPWSSANPLTVNYRVRQQKYAHGNLVHNASFELGKVKQVDSLTQSIVIEGWDIVGQNIRWLKILTDSVSGGNPFIHSGNRSIKIIREDASETDEIGAGVISDYIRVIPGNYHLSMFLSLVDIENPKSRLGTGIYDAIDIRIIYYDKNKISISSKQFSPYYNKYFNNSFKGESFSKYSRIDSTGWIHVQGRSHHFPVPDGDIQDDTKFIRIFIGLKGNGTMYIDDVNYEYTRWNFTQLERLEPYFDTTFSLSQLIIPQPRSVKIMESIIYYRPYYRNVFPVILIPGDAERITLHAAKRLENHIQQTISELTNIHIDSIPGLITNTISDQVRQSTVTFSIGQTELFKSALNSIPISEIEGKEQGFIVHTLNDELSVIYLAGNSSLSNYYAVQAAIQLFDNRRLLFHNANIIDFPENDVRPLMLDEISDYTIGFLRSTKSARFTQVYLPSKTQDLGEKVDRIADLGIHSLGLYTNLKSEIDIDIAEILTANSLISDHVFNIDACKNEPIMNGKKSKMIRFIEKLEELQISDYNLVIQPGNQCVSDFSSEIFKEVDEDISFIWTGNGRFTWKLDEADFLHNKIRFPGKTVFMDFTLYPRDRVSNYFMYDSLWPYKLAQASLFESYDNEIVPEIYTTTDKTILTFKADNLFDKIRLRTASDFFWNPDNYDPDLSLYRALISTLGVRLSEEFLYFNDHYFKARSELILSKSPKNYQKHIRRADTHIKELKNIQSIFLAQDHIRNNKELIDLIAGIIEEVELIRDKSDGSSYDFE